MIRLLGWIALLGILVWTGILQIILTALAIGLIWLAMIPTWIMGVL